MAGKANRNRNAGHGWEREMSTLLNDQKVFPEVGTARELSRNYDANKIDIVTRVIEEMPDLGLAIQAKTTTVTSPYPKLLAELKSGMKVLGLNLLPVVFHKHTKRVGERFMPKGNYAIMYLEDFIPLYTKKTAFEKGFVLLQKYFDCIPDEDKPEINKQLIKLGL